MPTPDGTELADELRRLKDRAGLSLSQLATRTWYSKSSLERYINGKVFPPRRVVEAISDSCGGDTDAMIAAWERAWSSQHSRSDRARPPATIDPGAGPVELPADLPDFTGRLAYRAALEAQLTADDSSAPAVAVISGMAGTGKTALAVHVAHRLRSYFPDGQLYLHLAGMSARPVQPRDALGQVLRSLGVAGAAIPDTLDERAGLYRSRIANRRMLVVVDDAASAAQVRPLIPGTTAAAVIVTSRTRVAALAGARLHQLEPFRPDEALELLRALVGAHRVDLNRAVAEQIASSCGNLPLAIRIAGSRLAGGLRTSLDDLAARLADERLRLNELAVGDIAVRSSLELSYRVLTGQQRFVLTAFAMLGISRVTSWQVAAVAGVDMVGAESLLDDLIVANLLSYAGQDGTGQQVLVMHDLVRDHAREQGAPDAELDAAVVRLLGAWLAFTELAETALNQRFFPLPQLQPVTWRPGGVRDGVVADSMSWYRVNRAALMHAVQIACDRGLLDTASMLAARLSSFFAAQSDWTAWRVTHESVLAASGGTDPYALRGLGELDLYLNRLSDALRTLTEARKRLEVHGDRGSASYVLILLGITQRKTGNLRSAGRYFGLAARWFEAADDDRGRAQISFQRGLQSFRQGRWPTGIAHLKDALAVLQSGDDLRSLAWIYYWLGVAHRVNGQPEAARHWLERGERSFTELSDRASAALCMREQAELLKLDGRPDDAMGLLVRALGIFRELGERANELVALESIGVLIGQADPDRGQVILGRVLETAKEMGRVDFQKRLAADIEELRRKQARSLGPARSQ